jgi:hypothetical protein
MFLAALVSSALLIAMFAAPRPACAQAAAQPILWQIGQFDHNDKEFALAPDNYKGYDRDPVYIVGQSGPRIDWPYVQPGPIDAWAGSRQHDANIYFALSQVVPQGGCTLTLALVDAQWGFPPHLQISVNGHAYDRSTIKGTNDDAIFGDASKGNAQSVTVDFPASLLKAGVNTVKISTVQGSWMLYDAVSLSAPTGITLGTVPPIAYLTSAEWLHDVLARQNGSLLQVLRLRINNLGPAQQAKLSVTGEDARTISVPAGSTSLDIDYKESTVAQSTGIKLESLTGAAFSALNAERLPCRRYTVYCVEQSHMDIGYAYLQQEATARHSQYLEAGLKANAEARAQALPSDDRFRWNIESLYEADDWLHSKASPAQIAEFVQDAKSGDLGLSAMYCNELTGLCKPEELLSLMTMANELRERYNIPIDSAMISDVPGYTWGMVPVLAQSGVKYWSWGPNPGDHMGTVRGFDQQAYYWLSPSGKDKVLVWQDANGYQPQFNDNDESLVGFLASFDRRFPKNPYDMIYDRRTVADNGPADMSLPPFVQSWNARFAYPHLVLTTTSAMFHDFETRYGKTLPTLRGDYTGFWEDGAASSANETAINRNAAETLAQDEILWSMLSPKTYPSSEIDDAWKEAVLYDEHTWGSYNSWDAPESDFTRQQWAYKRQFALDARSSAQTLQHDALKAVASPQSSNTVAIFNTCSWKRSDLVVLPASLSTVGDIVKNEQGLEMPSQRLADGTLAFVSGNIPPMSSRKFQISSGSSNYQGHASATTETIANGESTLHIDPQTGVISSWKVSGIDQDLVNARDTTCHGLNDYVYVLGESNDNVAYPSNVKLTVLEHGPLVASIRVDSLAPGSNSLSRTVTVVDGMPEIRFSDTFDKQQVHQNEAVHLGFSFDIPDDTVRMDMPWSVVRPDLDQTPHANKNIYPVNRWADLSNDQFGVTCANPDSPMLEIGAITEPRENNGGWLDVAKKGSTIYWNVINNYWHTNYKAYQPGSATFRYVVQAHAKYDQTAAQHFGIDQCQPLLYAPVAQNRQDDQLPLTLSNQSVLVTSCRPVGNGWLVRLFNGSDGPQTVAVGWKGAKSLALSKTDLFGNTPKPIKGPLSLVPMEIMTLDIRPS